MNGAVDVKRQMALLAQKIGAAVSRKAGAWLKPEGRRCRRSQQTDGTAKLR